MLYTKDGEEEYVVENSRTFKNRWIIKFEGIDNRDQSEAANGIVLYGEADDPEDMLEADEWYPKDLIGLEGGDWLKTICLVSNRAWWSAKSLT